MVHHNEHNGTHNEHDGSGGVSEGVNRIGRSVMDAAFGAHWTLESGLLESVYEACPAEELRQMGLKVDRPVGVPVTYGDVRMDLGYRLDLLVEGCVVVEVKSIDALASIHAAQVLTDLRFSGVRLGYLINFNTVRLKDGFRRLIL